MKFSKSTGEYKVSMKGCFIGGGRTCNMEECVDTSQAKKTNFCCCTGNRCNSEYRLVPTTTTKAPETEELTQPPKELSALVVILICCGAIFVVSVMFAGVYFYKSKKNIMFNEIPTVKLRGLSSRIGKKFNQMTYDFRMNRINMARIRHSINIDRFSCSKSRHAGDMVPCGKHCSSQMK